MTEFNKPPRETNADGDPRRVGVELEFAAVSATDAAGIVRSAFGGTIERVNQHKFKISDTALGDFEAELDWQFLHDGEDEGASEEDARSKKTDFQDAFRGVLGDVAATIVPCEIVCPPVALSELHRLDALLADLRKLGAQGTTANPLYAFGAQLNPEIAEKSAAYIVSVLKAYLLVSDWLRAVISLDLTRRVLTYTDPFPVDYVLKVVDPGYWPDMEDLIDDYLRHNPVRNRELDMLPLFSWLDRSRVQAVMSDARVKSRPTFHYRLPDTRLDRPDWTVATEWNRWCVVERLAERRDKLEAMARAYKENQAHLVSKDWAILASEWLAMP